MKKKHIVGIIIISIIIIATVGVFIAKKVIEDGKKYEIEKVDNYEYFTLKADNKYGVINKEGKQIINTEYTNVIIPNPQKPVFICYTSNSTKVLNQNGEEIFTEFKSIEPIKLKNIASSLMYEKSILTYKENEKFGLINLEGKKLTKAIYDKIEGLPYKEGELLVQKEGKYGVINLKGKELIKPQYDQINVDGYSNDENGYKNAGYIVGNKTEEGYRYGYIDINGKMLLELEYNEIQRITDVKENDIYLIAAKNGQYGLFKNKEQVIGNEYQSITYNQTDETLILQKTKKFGVANLDGKIIIPVEYKQIDSIGMYIYATNEDGTEKVYTKDGTEVQADSNIAILETSNENYKIKIDNTNGTVYSIIDKNDNTITKQNYSYIEYLSDDNFIVSLDGKLGVINSNNEIKIDIKYDSIEKLQNTDFVTTTLAKDKTTQIYDKNINKLCDLPNANIVVEKEYIKIYNDEVTKYFNLAGKEISSKEALKGNKIFATSNNGKWGFVDSNGNIILDYQYEKATDLNEYGFAGIKLDGKWGVVNSEGKVILEPQYIINTQLEPSFIGEYYKVEYGFGEFYYTK